MRVGICPHHGDTPSTVPGALNLGVIYPVFYARPQAAHTQPITLPTAAFYLNVISNLWAAPALSVNTLRTATALNTMIVKCHAIPWLTLCPPPQRLLRPTCEHRAVTVLNTFYENHPIPLTLDTGATSNMIRESCAKLYSFPMHYSSFSNGAPS